MPQVLATDDAYIGQHGKVLLQGMPALPFRLVDSSSFAASWSATLAVGNTTGIQVPVISTGSNLTFNGAPQPALSGNVRVPSAWSVKARDAADATDLFVVDYGVQTANRPTLGNDTNITNIRGTNSSSGALQVFAGGALKFRVRSTDLLVQVPIVLFDNAQLSPSLAQASAAAAGQTMSVVAQESTGAGGGALALAGGLGATTGGDASLTGGAAGANQQAGNAIVRGGSPSSGPFVGFAILRHSDGNDAVVVQDGVAHTGGQAIRIDAGGLAFFDGSSATRPSVTGATGGNAALQSLLSALDSMGLITDNTT